MGDWPVWQGSAQWDRLTGDLPEDEWAAKWGRAYVEFAAGEQRSWLHEQGVRFTPMVGWAERGDGRAGGHGNSVPRFHVAWGTGTRLSEPFANLARMAAEQGSVTFHHRHQVDALVVSGGVVTRGAPSNRHPVGEFELTA